MQQVDDSDYRCMLDNIAVSMGQTASDLVTVSGTIVFFEYQAQG